MIRWNYHKKGNNAIEIYLRELGTTTILHTEVIGALTVLISNLHIKILSIQKLNKTWHCIPSNGFDKNNNIQAIFPCILLM